MAIKVKPGEKVNKGDLLLSLEALKLENEIYSPIDGTVLDVLVAEGATVEVGQILVTIG